MPPLKLPADRGRTVLAQSTGFFQFPSQRYHEILQLRRGLVHRLAAAGKSARPVYAIEPLSFRTSYPSSDYRRGHPEPSGNFLYRIVVSHGSHQRPPSGLPGILMVGFLPMSTSSTSVFPLLYTWPKGAASGVTQGGSEC